MYIKKTWCSIQLKTNLYFQFDYTIYMYIVELPTEGSVHSKISAIS